MRGPRFDLPLENITWNLFLNEKWRLRDWHGSLQLQDQQVAVRPVVIDIERYVQNEAQLRQEKTKEAAQFLNLANSLIEQGDPQQARRAFQNAYGLSQHDQAFNEDARVQLNNLKVQQAQVGLNVRQARVAGGSGALESAPRELRENRAANYTPSEAQQLFDRNTAEENAVQKRLAERLVQQQEAATAKPAAIRATLPEQGRRITFTRPLEIDPWSELRLGVEAVAAGGVSSWAKLGLLVGLFAAAAVLVAVVRKPQGV